MYSGFVTPRTRSGGKQKLKVTAPVSANPRLSTILSPTTPGQSRRQRTSAKLKMLWPALEETESSNTTAISPVARRISSPLQSPSTRKTQTRISEIRELGTPTLSATGKRRTLKGVWPPPNPKQDIDKKPSVQAPKIGITQNRKSLFSKSSSVGSEDDGDTEKVNQFLNPKKPISNHTVVSTSTLSSSNEDWASVSDFNDKTSESTARTPAQQQSASSKKVNPENMDTPIILPSESSEHDLADRQHGGIYKFKDNNKMYIHSWDVWTEKANKPDTPDDSPLATPTRDVIPLRAKINVTIMPRVPDLVLSPHDRNRISGSQSSTPSTTTSDRQKLQLPTEGIESAAISSKDPVTEDVTRSGPKNDIAIKAKIDLPPIEFSPAKKDELPAQKCQIKPGLSPPEESSTALKEDAFPTANDTLSKPSLQHSGDENLEPDDESVSLSEDDSSCIEEICLEDEDGQASDNSPTSPTADSLGSLSPTENDEEELGLPSFIVPAEQRPLPPKTHVIRKRQRTEYRIRWNGPTTLDLSVYYPLASIPEVEDLPERDDRFETGQADGGLAMPMRSGRSIDGDSISLDSLLSDEGTIDSDDKSEISDKSQSSSHSRPRIHMRPVENDEGDDDDSKWKLRRVWDLEEIDEQENEHTVQRKEVMPSVKELCGVPANIKLSDVNNSSPWMIQRVNFVDDKEVNCEDEETFTSDEMVKEMEIITNKIDQIRNEEKTPPSDDPNTLKENHSRQDKAKQKAKRKSKKKSERKLGSSVEIKAKRESSETKPQNSVEKKVEREQKQSERKPKNYIDGKEGLAVMDTFKGTIEATPTTEEESMGSSRDSLQPLPRLVLPNGQKLPHVKRKKGRRTNYQLRYDGPSMLRVSELLSIPEEDNRFNDLYADNSMMPRPERRDSEHRRPLGELGELDTVPERPSRSRSNEDLDDMEFATLGETDFEGSNHSATNSARSATRPQLLMTPTKEQRQDMKWLVRRVWDVEEFDEMEDEYSVADYELTSKVRELFGVPSEVDLANMKSESRFQDVSSACDSAPFLLRRIHDFDGEIEEVEAGVEFRAADLNNTMGRVNAEARETFMWWDLNPASEPKDKRLNTKILKTAKEPWYSYNAEDEAKPKKVPRVLPWHKKPKKKEEEQEDEKMWWEE